MDFPLKYISISSVFDLFRNRLGSSTFLPNDKDLFRSAFTYLASFCNKIDDGFISAGDKKWTRRGRGIKNEIWLRLVRKEHENEFKTKEDGIKKLPFSISIFSEKIPLQISIQ